MASLQAKIGRKTQRKGENKNCHSVPFRSYPTRNRKFQRNRKKFQKCHYVIISSQNRLENAEKGENIKFIVPFRSYPTRN